MERMFKFTITVFTILVLILFQGCSKSDSYKENNVSLNINHDNEVNTTIPSDANTSSTNETGSQTKKEKDLFLSGTAIDGYIQGAKIEVIDLDSGKKFIAPQSTEAQGKWSFRLPKHFKNIAINIIGGIDEASKKPFEGILSNIPDEKQFIEVPKGGFPTDKELLKADKMIITPLTTLITNITVNKNVSKKEAKKFAKNILKIKDDFLETDYIHQLEKDPSNKELKNVYKKAVTLQKFTEIMTKTVVDKNLSFNKVFSIVSSSIAETFTDLNIVNENNQVEFETLLNTSFETIGKNVVKNIISLPSNDNLEDNISSQIMSFKVEAVQKTMKKMVKLINKTELTNVNTFAKATELVSTKIEEHIEEIAQVDLNNSVPEIKESIKTLSKEAEKVVNAVIVSGGLEKIANDISKLLDENKSLDTVLTENMIEEKSHYYNLLFENNLTEAQIFEYIEKNNSLPVIEQIDFNESNISSIENNITDYNISNLEMNETNITDINNSDVNISLEANITDEVNEKVEQTTTTKVVEAKIFYLNKWWSLTKYNELMKIMGEAPPPAMTDSNIYSTSNPETPNSTSTSPSTTSVISSDIAEDNSFSEVSETDNLVRNFQDVDELDNLNNLQLSQDFDSVNLLTALIMDFSKHDDNLTILKTIVLQNDNNFTSQTDLETLKTLIFNVDFSEKDENSEKLKDLLFNKDYVLQDENLASLKEIVFALDYSQQDDSLEQLKDLEYNRDFLEIDENFKTLKTLIFLLDFSQPDDNLEQLKDLLFNRDFNSKNENLEALKDLLFSPDFDAHEDLNNLTDLIFKVDFQVHNENLAELKDLVMTSDFETQEDLDKLKELTFKIDFENQTNLDELKDILFLANFKTQEDLDKLSDLLFDVDFSTQSDSQEELKNIIFTIDFADPNPGLDSLKELVFNMDFLDHNDLYIESLADLLFAVDFSRQDKYLERLRDIVFNPSEINQHDTNLSSLKNLLTSLDFENKDESLDEIRELMFGRNFETVEEKQDTLKTLILALDFSQKDNNLDILKDVIFAANFSNDYKLNDDKLQDLVFNNDFSTKNENLETLKNIVLSRDFQDSNLIEVDLEEILFSLDFSQKDENLETIKDIMFVKEDMIDFNDTVEDLKIVMFSLDFERRNDTFNTLKDLVIPVTLIDRPDDIVRILDFIYSLSFPTQDKNLATLKDVIFTNDGNFASLETKYTDLKDIVLNFDLNTSGDSVYTQEVSANNLGVVESAGKHHIPLFIDYFPNFQESVTFSEMYGWCRYTIFDYDDSLALDCLSDSLEDALHYEFKRIGYLQ